MPTTYVPIEASSPFPASPSFLAASTDPEVHLRKTIKSLLKAKRIAVVCGAGISVQAGIPDFRSQDGLFQSLKKDNPTLSSGKDLFDASVFNSEATTSLFCQMIAQLSEMSKTANPTAFHNLLRSLDDRGHLLRIYTQNIDALESKTGLTFGVPELDGGRPAKSKSAKGKAVNSTSGSNLDAQNHIELSTPEIVPAPLNVPSTSRLPSPPVETPRCIPLHGTLQAMHCQLCLHSFPLIPYLPSLASGSPPLCPECTSVERTRQLVGKRSRGIGKLRPSVVLYNEMHKDGEEVGEVVRRDLVGLGSKGKGKARAGADFLLVVGTSLRVPGTKRIVREFSKAVKLRTASASTTSSSSGSSSRPSGNASLSSASGLLTPSPSPRRSPSIDDDPPIRTVYLNLDFPVPTREWEGVFDVWVRGDAQTFASLVQEEIETQEREREEANERKREAAQARKLREELKERKRLEALEAEMASGKGKSKKAKGKTKGKEVVKAKVVSTKKRKAIEDHSAKPVKKRKVPSTKPVAKRNVRVEVGKVTGLTIKVPPLPLQRPLTPPNSQVGRPKPKVAITPRRSISSQTPSACVSPFGLSSPLSSIPPSSPAGTDRELSVGYASPPHSQIQLQAQAGPDFNGIEEPNQHVMRRFSALQHDLIGIEGDDNISCSEDDEVEVGILTEPDEPSPTTSPLRKKITSPRAVTPMSPTSNDDSVPFGLRSPFPTSAVR